MTEMGGRDGGVQVCRETGDLESNKGVNIKRGKCELEEGRERERESRSGDKVRG